MYVGTPTKSVSLPQYTNFIVKNSFKPEKKRNLWELPHFQVLNLK
ncbi:hypothetical protein LEP1GSC005_0951 [Leptospira santarosai str. ST188]|nr:hypothetical protein LEP1GSC071_1438 [Leptospira santarosai str. JET]EMF89971.1 hypothetical protein LEP1GSC005_0951 [Leptospira santarosai str. ST188]